VADPVKVKEAQKAYKNTWSEFRCRWRRRRR